MKRVDFHESVIEFIRSLSREARKRTGEALLDLQRGKMLSMPLSRAMPTVGLGVYELRIKDSMGEYRYFYYLKIEKSILVFHAFNKKTRKTQTQEIRLGQSRLRKMIYEA